MTPEQQRALALARARRRRAEAERQSASDPMNYPQEIIGGVAIPPPLELQDENRAAAALASQDQPQTWGEWAYGNIVGNPNDNVTNFGESLGSWLGRAGESATMGVIGDEASAAAYSLLPGRSYEDELQRFRQNEQDLGTLGRISADLAGGVVPALAGVGFVGNAARGLGGRMLAGAATGAGMGATQGFMEGEGGFGNRATGGLVGGTLGGVIGGAIPLAAEIGRSAVSSVKNNLRNRAIGREVGEALGVTPETGRVATALLGPEDQAAMRQALDSAGPDAMLADASGRAVGALDAVLQAPVPGVNAARQRVDQRAGNAYYDMMDALRGGRQGPDMGPVAAQRSMAQQARGGISDAYQKAYSTPIDYASEAGRRIEDIVEKLPTSTAKKAIQKATDRMIYDGGPNPQILASIGDDGAVAFTQQPNVMQLDYLKRAFDEIADDGKDALTGRMSSEGAFASRIARDIRDAIGDAVPSYKDALSSAATDIRQRSAMRTGSELLRPQTTVESVAEAIADATPAEVRAMRQGVIGQIDHTLGNVRAVATDQNIDARQAMQALRDLSSSNSQRKLSSLFGDEWPSIKEAIDQGSAALGLRAGIAGNSRTFGRDAAMGSIKEVVTPPALSQFRPVEAMRNFASGAIGASPEAIARNSQAVQSELADLLTRQGGTPQKAISAVAEALSRRPVDLNAGGNTAVGTALGAATLSPALIQELLRGQMQ